MIKRKIEFYYEQLSKRKKNIPFIGDKEIKAEFNLGSGAFAECCVQENFERNYITRGNQRIIKLSNGKKYHADGYISSLDCYTEVKNFSFYSSGTACEKLLGMFLKLEKYDKPTLIIFCGEYELLTDEFSYKIWNTFHNSSTSPALTAMIDKVRDKIVDIVKLSELSVWCKKNNL